MPAIPRKNRSNLGSPAAVRQPCQLKDLHGWVLVELAEADLPRPESLVVKQVLKNVDAFVRWPERALLLWEGRDRSHKYHSYPESIRCKANKQGVRLDGRVNGPAVASYRLAGGVRPKRLGSNNDWSVHHLYSGKFPYVCAASTLHAAHDGRHCTQSAGLVAVHPIADQMCDEYPFFAWLLRAAAFLKFGYDPDGTFYSGWHNRYGFARGHGCRVVEAATVRCEPE